MIFYIIAGGPSYIDVTEEEWKFLEDKHTITFARVPYGSRRTEYYLSIERDYIDKSVLTYMSKIGNIDTKLLLSIPESLKLARELGFSSVRQIYKKTFYFMPSRKPWFIDEDKPPHSFQECRAKNFHQPIFRFRGQLTAIINACVILGATDIRLIGVDLNDQRNFYQNYDILDSLCKDKKTVEDYIEFDKINYSKDIEAKRKTYKAFNQDIMHTTNIPYSKDRWNGRQLRGVADLIKWMNEEMKEECMEGIFVTNKNSLLYKEKKIDYKSIIE